MQFVEPKIFCLGYTCLDPRGVKDYLEWVGVPDWNTQNTPSEAEALLEIAGRTCYRSFAPKLNKNVERIREGNDVYLANIIGKHDGSVLEHATVTYAIVNVSRVFTHELVRHRHCAFSQESLRYVRLDELSMYYPDAFRDHPKSEQLLALFKESVYQSESLQIELAELLGLDDSHSFDEKKALTSAMRRLAPDGLTTRIIVTTNHRNWRWLIEMRTAVFAEEEIRKVFYLIYKNLKNHYPNIYFDARETADSSDIPTVTFSNSKI